MSYNQRNNYQCVSVKIISKNSSINEGLCYYAQVELNRRTNNGRSEPIKNLEFVLNGSGINKALKKVTRELIFRGIVLPKNLREITIPYRGPQIE
jgi:hypothetical protein